MPWTIELNTHSTQVLRQRLLFEGERVKISYLTLQISGKKAYKILRNQLPDK
jgi:hypothetical protein